MTVRTAETRTTLPRVTTALIFVFILVGGALRSVEAGCQNSLKLALKNVWLCGVISYAVAFTGFAIFLAVALAVSSNRPWPTRADIRTMPRWAPFGGLLGGAAILAMISVASDVGAGTFNALIIAGQMFGALAIDHFGLMGFPRRAVNPKRVAACVMIIVGIYLMATY
ncbi:DMT family transporter [Streptomyces gardneri]|uniref:DMT family transporter n=1 Tax=Nocardia TaxID=1817 RepID=UPI00135B288A|nr:MULTISPECIES: DMT family transporter [Nocardia]MBF6168473.1 DMT family transporter [Streptomyces gardneri]MBF6207736.1 DMT family transporter [Streptomyces gardneri]